MNGAFPAGKKKDIGWEHVENRKEITASISLAREGIKGDSPILELTEEGIYFDLTWCFPVFLNEKIWENLLIF